MKILIVGVSGFIGHYLYQSLDRSGFNMLGVSRREISGINWRECSFEQSEQDWMPILINIDLVINAAGIYQETDKQKFSRVHNLGPIELFVACEKSNIRVIQISAIGAEKDNPGNEFLQSKRIADQYLLNSKLSHRVLYPGIVLGEGGSTTWQLSHLAQLPCVPVLFGKQAKLPVISIYQLSDHIKEHIKQIVKQGPASMCDKPIAEIIIAKAETFEELLKNMRCWLQNEHKAGKTNSCFLYIPQVLIQWVFTILPRLRIGAFNKQSLEMLNDFTTDHYLSTVNETASNSLLTNKASVTYVKNIKYNYLYYANLLTLSLIWLGSGISSLINFEQSRELISVLGLQQVMGDQLIIVAAIIDILLGLSMWVVKLRTRVVYLQIGVMLVYSLLVAVILPGYWLHPFAPMIKNLAMLVLAVYLVVEKKET